MGKLTEGLGATGCGMTRDDLLAWCDQSNRDRLAGLMGRWYFVAERDGRAFVDCLEGPDGANARLMAQRKPVPDFYGWPTKRMDGYRRWLSGCVERGIERVPA